MRVGRSEVEREGESGCPLDHRLATCERLLKCGLASFIIFFFLSFLIVKYSDKFDRFEMKIWKWKSNDDANVVKYVTNRRAVSSNGELCFVDF